MYQRTEQEIMKNWKGNIDIPLVSICTITYNHEKFIAEALDSFLMQETAFSFEVLINDDFSTDDTANIIREYEKKYPRIIKPIYQKENQASQGVGPNTTFNFPRVKGEYIALCEGDDYWTDPLKLQKQADFLISNPLYSGCFHDCMRIYEGKESHQKQQVRIGDRKIVEEVDLISIIDENNIAMASIMYKNSIEEIPKYWQETSKGDYALMVTIAEQGKIKYLPGVMSVYRVHDGGIWSSRGEIYKEEEAIKFYHLLQEYFVDDSHTLKAISRKLKYIYYLLSRKLVYDKQRLKSLHYFILSLDLLHHKHPNIKYYTYFKEFLKSIVK